jgi:hypothetical protein
LCPPSIEKVEGGTHKASKAQRWQWRCWLKFWDEVESLKKQLKTEVCHFQNGDVVDDPYHATTEIISKHKKTILNIALAVQGPALDVVDYNFFVTGTNAHVGLEGGYEWLLADDISAEPDPDGALVPSRRYVEVSGVNFDLAHHPSTMGFMPHTQKAAAMRESFNIAAEYNRRGEKLPDIAIRSHVHYFADSGIDTYPRVIFTPGWQLTTSFGHRKGGAIRPIGGVIIICEDGNYDIKKPKLYEPRRVRPWRVDRRPK